MNFTNGDFVAIDSSAVYAGINGINLIAMVVDSFFNEDDQEIWYEVEIGAGLGLGIFRTECSESELMKFKKGC